MTSRVIQRYNNDNQIRLSNGSSGTNNELLLCSRENNHNFLIEGSSSCSEWFLSENDHYQHVTDEDKVNQMNQHSSTPTRSNINYRFQPRINFKESEPVMQVANFYNENAVPAVEVFSPNHKLKDNDTSIEVEKITDTSARLSGGTNLHSLIQQNIGIGINTGPMSQINFDENCDVFKNSFDQMNNNSCQNMIIESNDESFHSSGKGQKNINNILKYEDDQNIIEEVEGEVNIKEEKEACEEMRNLLITKKDDNCGEAEYECDLPNRNGSFIHKVVKDGEKEGSIVQLFDLDPQIIQGSELIVQNPEEIKQEHLLGINSQKIASNYVCSIDTCGKIFQFKSEFERHMKVHSKELPFKCSICPKAFKRLDNFKVHQRIHTDERPYVCGEENCLERFRTKAALNYHVRKHQKDFLCEHKGCNKAFSSEAELTKHLKSKHIFFNHFDVEYDEEVRKRKEITLEELKKVEKKKACTVFTQANTEEMIMEKEMKKKKFNDFNVVDSVIFAEDYLKSKDMKEKALHELITKKKHRKKKKLENQEEDYDFLEVIAKKIEAPENDASGKSKVNEHQLYQKICQLLYTENRELKKKVKYFEGIGRKND